MDDVAIVGAGPAGSLAAILLARAGLRVTVFDRAKFPRAKLCGDTLNPGACRILSRHLSLAPLLRAARPLRGMLLTGPGGVRVLGRYGDGVTGYAVERRLLDFWLLERAAACGARIKEGCAVATVVKSGERVTGVHVRGRRRTRTHAARMVIAADGRRSLAMTCGLTTQARSPRRWAMGTYFTGVTGLSDYGEMHVRDGYYIGVAPLPGGLANTCLVMPLERLNREYRHPALMIRARLAADPELGPRFALAHMVQKPVVLGPLAVEAYEAGINGLLLAGDAAGFIDPMTGDGLTFALRGAELAAETTLDVFSGAIAPQDAPRVLRERRDRAFRWKWRFNRALRRLVASPASINGAAMAARILPPVFQTMIRYAGDVRRH